MSEIKGKDTYSNSETFKSRITDPKRDFEPKGLKSFDGINYSNYICSTNNINSVSAGEMIAASVLLSVIIRKQMTRFTL